MPNLKLSVLMTSILYILKDVENGVDFYAPFIDYPEPDDE